MWRYFLVFNRQHSNPDWRSNLDRGQTDGVNYLCEGGVYRSEADAWASIAYLPEAQRAYYSVRTSLDDVDCSATLNDGSLEPWQIDAIAENGGQLRRQARFKLAYDKATRTIVPEKWDSVTGLHPSAEAADAHLTIEGLLSDRTALRKRVDTLELALAKMITLRGPPGPEDYVTKEAFRDANEAHSNAVALLSGGVRK